MPTVQWKSRPGEQESVNVLLSSFLSQSLFTAQPLIIASKLKVIPPVVLIKPGFLESGERKEEEEACKAVLAISTSFYENFETCFSDKYSCPWLHSPYFWGRKGKGRTKTIHFLPVMLAIRPRHQLIRNLSLDWRKENFCHLKGVQYIIPTLAWHLTRSEKVTSKPKLFLGLNVISLTTILKRNQISCIFLQSSVFMDGAQDLVPPYLSKD